MYPVFKNVIAGALVALSCVQGFSQFEKTYPTTRDRALRDVIRLPDGGYMLCGWSNVADPTESDALLMRTDNNGNEVSGFPKLLGKSGTAKVDFAYSMIEAGDGNYLITGYSYSYGGGDCDIVLWKVDINGNEVMPAKTYGSFGWDEGRKIIKTSDGNFVICGSSTINGDQQACLIKIDKDGNTIWNPAIQGYGPGGSKQFGNSVQQAPDGGYIVVGATQVTDPKGDAYIVKVKADGTQDWEKVYAESLADEITGVVINNDGSFVCCIRDSTGSGNQENIDVLVRKFDPSGIQLGGYGGRFGGVSKDTPKCISLAKDGNYYVGAISRSFNWWGQNQTMDYPDQWLLKINAANGDTIWSRHFGNVDHDHLEQAIPDPVENAILLCGHSVAQPYVKKAYFLKLNADGLVAALGIHSQVADAELELYPNPSSGAASIDLGGVKGVKRIVIHNSVGQQVFSATDFERNSGTLSLSLDQPEGIYFVTVELTDSVKTGRLVVQR